MNQSLLLLVVATICLLACSHTFPPEGSDLATRELKGPVKFVEAKTYWAKRRAKPFDLDNLRLADDFRGESKHLWYFNKDGNITQNSYYDDDQLKWELIDSYDNRGNHIQRLHYSFSRGKVVDRTYVFTYDDNNKLLEEHILDIDSVLLSKKTVSYNQQEQKIKEVKTSGKTQKILQTSTFKYDKNNRVIEKYTTHWLNDVNPPIKVLYSYDWNSPNISTKTVYRSDSIITREEKYKYHRGNQLKEQIFVHPVKRAKRRISFNEEGWAEDIKDWKLAEEDQLIKHTEKEYKYDPKGNWTQKVTYEDDVLKAIEFRKIQYYQLE